MNKAIILAVQELYSRFIVGSINELTYQKELDKLLELEQDENTKQYIISFKDRDI